MVLVKTAATLTLCPARTGAALDQALTRRLKQAIAAAEALGWFNEAGLFI